MCRQVYEEEITRLRHPCCFPSFSSEQGEILSTLPTLQEEKKKKRKVVNLLPRAGALRWAASLKLTLRQKGPGDAPCFQTVDGGHTTNQNSSMMKGLGGKPNACSPGEDQRGLPACFTWWLSEIQRVASPAQPCAGALEDSCPLQQPWKSFWLSAFTPPRNKIPGMKILVWAQPNLWGKNNLEVIPKNPQALDPNLKEYTRRSDRWW